MCYHSCKFFFTGALFFVCWCKKKCSSNFVMRRSIRSFRKFPSFRLSQLSVCPSHSGFQVLLLISLFHIIIIHILLVLRTVCRTLPICKDIAYSFSRRVRIRNRKYVLFKMAAKFKNKRMSILPQP
jgi:hypothetical protein